MSTSNLVNWQILLHFLRIIFLIPSVIICFTWGRRSGFSNVPFGIPLLFYDSPPFWYFLAITAFLWSWINDLYMLTWDAYTYGSFIATIIPQTFTSLSAMTFIIFLLVKLSPWYPGDYPIQDLLFASLSLSLFVSVVILVIHAYLWIKGSRSFKRGVKDMRGRLRRESGISVCGWKRSCSERRRIGKAIPRWFSSVIFRRIEGVERLTLAATRNIFAMLLLMILLVQSVVLCRGVLYEDHLIRAASPLPGEVPEGLTPFGIIYEQREIDQPWSPYVLLSTSINVSTDDVILQSVLQSESAVDCTTPHVNQTICQPFNVSVPLELATVVDIVLTVGANGTDSLPGGIWIWIGTLQSGVLPPALVYPNYLIPGYHLFGFMELTQWKFINPSFLEKLGFSPTYNYRYSTSVRWMERTALDNTSIARATVQLSSPQHPISSLMIEYRTHTFLNALTSIGGLLAAFQSFHLLCFGRPLFWGLFGSKLLDPFGIFVSNTLRGDIRKKYISGPSNVLDLPLFLNDFVIEMGPLDPGDRGSGDSGEEIELLVPSRNNTSNSPSV